MQTVDVQEMIVPLRDNIPILFEYIVSCYKHTRSLLNIACVNKTMYKITNEYMENLCINILKLHILSTSFNEWSKLYLMCLTLGHNWSQTKPRINMKNSFKICYYDRNIHYLFEVSLVLMTNTMSKTDLDVKNAFRKIYTKYPEYLERFMEIMGPIPYSNAKSLSHIINGVHPFKLEWMIDNHISLTWCISNLRLLQDRVILFILDTYELSYRQKETVFNHYDKFDILNHPDLACIVKSNHKHMLKLISASIRFDTDNKTRLNDTQIRHLIEVMIPSFKNCTIVEDIIHYKLVDDHYSNSYVSPGDIPVLPKRTNHNLSCIVEALLSCGYLDGDRNKNLKDIVLKSDIPDDLKHRVTGTSQTTTEYIMSLLPKIW